MSDSTISSSSPAGASFAKALRAYVGRRQRVWLTDALAVVCFLALSVCFFLTPLSQGLVLGGHDSVASQGLGQEQRQYRATHDGATSRWSNAIFSGMPTYQIAPSYGSATTLGYVENVVSLGTLPLFPATAFVFLYLVGFYILLRALRLRAWLALAGSVMWAFSSYFHIIIAAGHLWKVLTLAFIPPTIGGMLLCYRGRYVAGIAVTALFTALQLHSNHLQMTYYFLFVMGLIALCYLVDALRRRVALTWVKATAAVALAGGLGVVCNVSNLYHTYDYAKYSMRGKAELSPLPSQRKAASQATDGLDRDYITAWSYGIDETMTLLIPDYKGGGSASILDYEGVEELKGYDDFYAHAGETQAVFQEQQIGAYPPGVMLYWGDQPFTVGPVYVGAVVCFFFVLGLFYVRGPLKWALLAATLLSFVFAWGKHIPEVTNFLIDHLPLYSKFRTVSSALVIAELTMPLLAILAVAAIVKRPTLFTLTVWRSEGWRKQVGLPVAFVLTAGVCFALWVMPSLAGSCLSASDAQTLAMMKQGGFPADFVDAYSAAISAMHHAILGASAGRSLLFILVAVGLMTFVASQLKDNDRARSLWTTVAAVGLAAICLIDLLPIDRRYLNNDSFTSEADMEAAFQPSAADREILKDTTYYRVANIGLGNPFNETSNATAYYHHSIGGYHAAKMHRYQDLIDRRLNAELNAFVAAINEHQGDLTAVDGDSIAPCLNMLHTKYFIFGQGERSQAVVNPFACGNAWFVSSLRFVKGADAEMAALDGLDTKHEAVADDSFRPQLDGSALDSGTVRLTAYDTDRLSYECESRRGGVVVFSDIYYPGWTVTIDGREVEPGRVNYVLRALKVPAGKHTLVFDFHPASITITEALAYAGIALIALLLLLALYFDVRKGHADAAQ